MDGCQEGVILLQARREPMQAGQSSVQGLVQRDAFLGACAVTQKGWGREGICHLLRCGKGREGRGSHGEPDT